MMQTIPEHDLLNPYPYYAHMRNHHPVWQDEKTGLWYVFRYREVLQVLNPPTTEAGPTFSSNLSAAIQPHIPFHDSMISMNGTEHKRVRAFFNDAFSPGRLRTYIPRFIRLIDGLLDQVVDRGEMELINAFAYLLPALIISELLGIPPEDRDHFRHWAQPLLLAGDELMTHPPSTPELDTYLMHLITERRLAHDDRNDLISVLVRGKKTLTDAELLGNCELLLIAGYETSASLLCNLFRVLDEFPEIQRTIWKDPTQIPPSIEETLRYSAPVLVQVRVTMRESVLGNTAIPAHQTIVPLLGSANRDERKFVDPDCFLLDRPNVNEHVAFGLRGPHFCIGAPLARLEARLALGQIVKRMQNIQIDHSTPLEQISSLTTAVKRLRVTFEPRTVS